MASAAISADLARDHTLLRGVICGAGHAPHCGWCYGAVGLALAGLAALTFATRAAAIAAVGDTVAARG